MPVELCDVGHRFTDQQFLFRHMSGTLEHGQVYALTGSSGSGKSTLLSLLARWIEPAEGAVKHHGIDTVGWVFQNPYGVPGRTALDHVVLPLLAQRMTRDEGEMRARDILQSFGLAGLEDQPFWSLSGGEAQRLMLARGIAAAPDLFLVDEPTAQLDMRTATSVSSTLRALSGTGAIVVVATHDTKTRDACTFHIDLERFQ